MLRNFASLKWLYELKCIHFAEYNCKRLNKNINILYNHLKFLVKENHLHQSKCLFTKANSLFINIREKFILCLYILIQQVLLLLVTFKLRNSEGINENLTTRILDDIHEFRGRNIYVINNFCTRFLEQLHTIGCQKMNWSEFPTRCKKSAYSTQNK